MWYNSLWLWRWLLRRLSKRQSLSTKTVLFRITFTRMIKLNLLLTIICYHHHQCIKFKNTWRQVIFYIIVKSLCRAQNLNSKTCFSICLQIIIMYLQILESQTNTLLAQQAWYVLKQHLLYFTNLLNKWWQPSFPLELKVVTLSVNK